MVGFLRWSALTTKARGRKSATRAGQKNHEYYIIIAHAVVEIAPV